MLLVFFILEKEPPSYAEVSLEETPLTTTNKSLSDSSGRHSTGSIHHENSTQQIITTTTPIKTDDINTPTTFT